MKSVRDILKEAVEVSADLAVGKIPVISDKYQYDPQELLVFIRDQGYEMFFYVPSEGISPLLEAAYSNEWTVRGIRTLNPSNGEPFKALLMTSII